MNIIEINDKLGHIVPTVTSTTRQVPRTIPLDRLQLTPQAAVGWTNSHPRISAYTKLAGRFGAARSGVRL